MKAKKILSFVLILCVFALCPAFVGCKKGKSEITFAKAQKELADCCFTEGYKRTDTAETEKVVYVRSIGGKANANLGAAASGKTSYVKDGVLFVLDGEELSRIDDADAASVLSPIVSPFKPAILVCASLEETGAKKITKKSSGGKTTYEASGSLQGGTKISSLVTLKNKKLESVKVTQVYGGETTTILFEAFSGDIDFDGVDFSNYSYEMSHASFESWASEHLNISFSGYELSQTVGQAQMGHEAKVKVVDEELVMADVVSINGMELKSYLVGDTYYYEQFGLQGAVKKSAVRDSSEWQSAFSQASMYLVTINELLDANDVNEATLTVSGARETLELVATTTDGEQTVRAEFTIVIDGGKLVSVVIVEKLLGVDSEDVVTMLTAFDGEIELPADLNEQTYPRT